MSLFGRCLCKVLSLLFRFNFHVSSFIFILLHIRSVYSSTYSPTNAPQNGVEIYQNFSTPEPEYNGSDPYQKYFGLFTINYNDADPNNLAVKNNPIYIPPESPSLQNSSWPADVIEPPRNFSASYLIPRNASFIMVGGLFGVTNGTNGIYDRAGVQMAEAFKSAILEINNSTTILPSTTVLYQIMDTGRDPKDALNAAYLLIQQNVTSFVGLRDISEVISIQPLLSNSNITMLSGAAMSTYLSNTLNYPTFYRTIPDDLYVAQSITKLMQLFNWTLVSAIYTDDDIGSSGNSAFQTATTESGIVVTCSATIVSGSTSGLQTFSSCISSSDANAVVLWMGLEDARNVIASLSTQPFISNLYFIAPPEWGTYNSFQSFSLGRFNTTILQGGITAIPRSGNIPVSGSIPPNGSFEAFKSYWSQLNPSNNAYSAFLQLWQDTFRCSLYGSIYMSDFYLGYGISNLTFDSNGTVIIPPVALPLGGKNQTLPIPPGSKFTTSEGSGSKTRIVTLSNPFADLPGTNNTVLPLCPTDVNERNKTEINCMCTGSETLYGDDNIDFRTNYVYDATRALLLAFDQIMNKCTHVKDPNLCDQFLINSSILLGAVDATNFYGRTGHVEWIGHDRAHGVIDFYQFTPDGSKRFIGYYSSGAIFIYEGQLEFRSPYTLPLSKIIPDVVSASDAISIVVIVISAVVIVFALLFQIYFTKHKKSRVIAKATFLFVTIFHLGIIFVCVCLIVWSFTPNKFTCTFKIFIGLAGYSYLVGGFLAKIYRYFKVVNNFKIKGRYLPAIELLLFVGSIALVNVTLVIILDTIYGAPTGVVVQSTTDELYNYVECRIPDYDFQITMTVIILVFNGIVTLVAAVLAIFARKVDTPYGESRFISFALYDFVIVLGVLIPIYFTGNDGFGSESRQYILRSLVILFVVIFTLAVISIPKALAIRKSKGQRDSMIGDEGEVSYDTSVPGITTSIERPFPSSYPFDSSSIGKPPSTSGSDYLGSGQGLGSNEYRGTTSYSSENRTIAQRPTFGPGNRSLRMAVAVGEIRSRSESPSSISSATLDEHIPDFDADDQYPSSIINSNASSYSK